MGSTPTLRTRQSVAWNFTTLPAMSQIEWKAGLTEYVKRVFLLLQKHTAERCAAAPRRPPVTIPLV